MKRILSAYSILLHGPPNLGINDILALSTTLPSLLRTTPRGIPTYMICRGYAYIVWYVPHHKTDKPTTSTKEMYPLVGMPDVQNFFHEALAVIISKLQYLYTRRKLSVSSLERYHFPVARSMCA